MDIRNFDIGDWEFEISSGFRGYRHKQTQEWIHQDEFIRRQDLSEQWHTEYNLLHKFRMDCLPFGEYPDIVLIEFLNKRHNNEQRATTGESV